MIADELNKLKQTKALIKLALIDKGLNPTDEFASYVGNIAGISSGEDPFLPLGYSIPLTVILGINYGVQLKLDVENGVVTNLSNNSDLIFLPNIDFSNKKINGISSCPKFVFADIIDFSKCSGSLYLSSNTALARVNSIILPDKSAGNSCRGFFNGCTSLEYIGEIKGKISDVYNFFNGCTKLELIPKLDTSMCTTLSFMFSGCKSLTSLDLSDWDFTKVTDLNLTFANCENLVDLKLPDNFGANVSSGYSTFYRCVSLSPNTDFSKINVSNTTELRYYFLSALYNIERLDLTSWNTAKVKNFQGFLMDLSGSDGGNLKEVIISNWTFESATNLSSMFAWRRNLVHLDISSADTSKVTNFSSMFQWNNNLKAVKGAISMKGYTSTVNGGYMFSSVTNAPLRYITFKDIGYNSGNTQWGNMLYNKNWGIEDEEDEWTIGARDTLTDTLITYSFDRATAGYSVCLITLATETKALLTEDEIALITAKGYTIA